MTKANGGIRRRVPSDASRVSCGSHGLRRARYGTPINQPRTRNRPVSRQTMYIIAAVVAVLVLLYVFGVFGGGEVTTPGTTG